MFGLFKEIKEIKDYSLHNKIFVLKIKRKILGIELNSIKKQFKKKKSEKIKEKIKEIKRVRKIIKNEILFLGIIK